jgi:hypothetical protein
MTTAYATYGDLLKNIEAKHPKLKADDWIQPDIKPGKFKDKFRVEQRNFELYGIDAELVSAYRAVGEAWDTGKPLTIHDLPAKAVRWLTEPYEYNAVHVLCRMNGSALIPVADRRRVKPQDKPFKNVSVPAAAVISAIRTLKAVDPDMTPGAIQTAIDECLDNGKPLPGGIELPELPDGQYYAQVAQRRISALIRDDPALQTVQKERWRHDRGWMNRTVHKVDKDALPGERVCANCSKDMRLYRANAHTCSAACRKAYSRKVKADD